MSASRPVEDEIVATDRSQNQTDRTETFDLEIKIELRPNSHPETTTETKTFCIKTNQVSKLQRL